MRFKVGDYVVHPSHGVGYIVKLDKRGFSDQETRLYYEISTEKSTVWIPVEDYQSIGLRYLTTKSELARYRSLLKSPPADLDKNFRKRQLEFADRLREGTFQVVCEIVRDLTALSWRRQLSEGDSTWLRKARYALYQEWAAASGISQQEAVQEIDTLLMEARKQYAS